MSFTLTTPRLILRDFTDEDLAAYTHQCQDRKYQRFYADEDTSEKHCAFLVDMFVKQAAASPRVAYHLAVIDKETNQYMGIVGLRLEDHRQASVGCGLQRDYHHSGLAQEAMHALVDYGFAHLNVHRVYAETIKDNRPAVLLCKKLGMKTEGELVEHRYFKDRWWTTKIMAIRQTEWQRNEQNE